MVFAKNGTNEFVSTDEDLSDLFSGEPISHPVVIDGVREPRNVYDMNSIHRWLTERHSEPFTREAISRNFRLTTARDRNPNSPYNYEALLQAERDNFNGGIGQGGIGQGGIGQHGGHGNGDPVNRVREGANGVHAEYEEARRQAIIRVMVAERQRRAISERDMQIQNRNAFERRVHVRYNVAPPYGESAQEWGNLITERLRRLERGIFLIRGYNPDDYTDILLRISVPDEMVREGCEMLYIDFVPENRSFIVTRKVYNGYTWIHDIGEEVINTSDELIAFCDASMERTFRILQERGVIH
jgi:hypothetical protein